MPGEAITAGDIGFLILLIGTIAGAWWRVESAIAKAKADSIVRAEAAISLANLTREELAAHKLHVAETYITKAGLRETTDQIMSGVNGIRESIDRMNERMDRVVEGATRAKNGRPP